MVKNKDEIREYHKRWENDNPKKVKEYRRKNAERLKEYNRKYYQKNRHKILEQQKKCWKKYRERYNKLSVIRHHKKTQWINDYIII